ncbi:MAG: heme-binding protein, partial [Candidatus Dadabacteria bacterium]
MRKVILLALIIAIAIQFVPVKMENPPHIAPSLPEKVLKILKKGCYDCHSNTTRWPWYSRIAPISWLIANDVTEGREELNFSRWNSMNERTKKKKIREIWEEVSEGEMPPLLYSVM